MSKRPQDNAFQQQRLKAWQPLLTPKWVIGTFAVIAIVFIPLGCAILSASNSVYEEEVVYTTDVPAGGPDFPELCTAQNDDCQTVSIQFPALTEDVKAPIYFYYKLTNFYQNHRRYVKSRNDDQLQGILDGDISSCDPLDTFNDVNLYPCGLIANSVFNDTFQAVTRPSATGDPTNLTWNEEDIAWTSDEHKFKYADIDGTDLTDIGPGGFVIAPNGVNDPHFMVWMRTAGLPTFKKLYAVIEEDLAAGTILEINLINTFPVAGFDGTKSMVLSTTSWLGGKNDFLGYAYIIVGAVCLVLAVAFAAKAKLSPRDLGDMKYFNWPSKASAEEQ